MHYSGRSYPSELSAAVYALAENEITLCEFRDAVRFVPADALQVVATILACRACLMSNPSMRVSAGRALCASAAALHRSSN